MYAVHVLLAHKTSARVLKTVSMLRVHNTRSLPTVWFVPEGCTIKSKMPLYCLLYGRVVQHLAGKLSKMSKMPFCWFFIDCFIQHLAKGKYRNCQKCHCVALLLLPPTFT